MISVLRLPPSMRNSASISTATMRRALVLTCLTAAMAGYALAKKRFVGRSILFTLIVCAMALPKQEYRAERAIRAVQSLSEAAQQNGTADMSLDEINAEIAASRADRASRNARNGA